MLTVSDKNWTMFGENDNSTLTRFRETTQGGKKMRKNKIFGLDILWVLVLFFIIGFSYSCNPDQVLEENVQSSIPLIPEDQVRLSNDPERTEIFRDAGLGLFIHWGPNSQIGSEISWPLNNASPEFAKKYYALAETFNPERFDAAQWARLAKQAGMEYVVFTAKHHDGFCMFDTSFSDFKITNTPYGRDIAAQIAEAFKKEGLLVGFYYSPGDFRYHYETGVPQKGLMTPAFESDAPFGPMQKDFISYEQGHVEELLTHYADIFMLWFDGQCEPLKKHAWRIRQDLFIGRGEIPTPEQRIPGEEADHAWESCMTTSWQWSYQPHPDIRTSKEIIQNLIKIRARGGNMLLNVGPMPDGRISPQDEAILRDLGLWMLMYGESVRSVRPWTVTNERDVWLTQKKNGENSILYAIADFDYDAEGTSWREFSARRLTLKSVQATESTSVSILSQSGECQWEQDEGGLHIAAFNNHTVQIIAYPGSNPEFKDRGWSWGPDWPVAIKITNVKPVQR
jgi:alpha-L-fucosidase